MLEVGDKERLRARLAARSGGNQRGKLSKADRELMVREFIAGIPVAQIAVRFGVTPPTVEYHLKRAAR